MCGDRYSYGIIDIRYSLHNSYSSLQVDLVDMRSCSDRGYRWIGHYKDHFSKFSIIWPQKKKCAAETIECLERFVFAYLGVPKLLQSDNGKEFNNHVSNFS